jgi:hypothetical protein
MTGERPMAYRRRLLRPFQKYCDSFKDVDLHTITDNTIFDGIEAKVFADALEAANRPIVGEGVLQERTDAASVLEKKGSRLRDWLARHGNNFATEFAKESGKQLAKWGWPALIVLVASHLLDVGALVAKWLAALGMGLPF